MHFYDNNGNIHSSVIGTYFEDVKIFFGKQKKNAKDKFNNLKFQKRNEMKTPTSTELEKVFEEVSGKVFKIWYDKNKLEVSDLKGNTIIEGDIDSRLCSEAIDSLFSKIPVLEKDELFNRLMSKYNNNIDLTFTIGDRSSFDAMISKIISAGADIIEYGINEYPVEMNRYGGNLIQRIFTDIISRIKF